MYTYTLQQVQPLLGLMLGLGTVVCSAYFRWKFDAMSKEQNQSHSENKKMTNDAVRVISSIGLATGGVMVILAIKFLTS